MACRHKNAQERPHGHFVGLEQKEEKDSHSLVCIRINFHCVAVKKVGMGVIVRSFGMAKVGPDKITKKIGVRRVVDDRRS